MHSIRQSSGADTDTFTLALANEKLKEYVEGQVLLAKGKSRMLLFHFFSPVCSLFWALSMHQHVAKFMQGYKSVLFEVSLSGRMSGEAKITMNPQG